MSCDSHKVGVGGRGYTACVVLLVAGKTSGQGGCSVANVGDAEWWGASTQTLEALRGSDWHAISWVASAAWRFPRS